MRKEKKISKDKQDKHDLVKWKHNQNCANCGDTRNITIHHIIPKSLKGLNEMSNYVVLCRKCHDQVHGKNESNKIITDVNWTINNDNDKRRWTEDDIDLIVQLKKEGYPYEQIAELLGRSISSCSSMIHNVKLGVDKLSMKIWKNSIKK